MKTAFYPSLSCSQGLIDIAQESLKKVIEVIHFIITIISRTKLFEFMKNLIHDDEIISSAIDYVSSILVNGSFEILWDMIEKLFAPLYQNTNDRVSIP